MKSLVTLIKELEMIEISEERLSDNDKEYKDTIRVNKDAPYSEINEILKTRLHSFLINKKVINIQSNQILRVYNDKDLEIISKFSYNEK